MYCLTGAAREYRKMVVVVAEKIYTITKQKNTQRLFFFCGPLLLELLLGKDYSSFGASSLGSLLVSFS